jgi:RNA polymerase-binding transcription factor DksA
MPVKCKVCGEPIPEARLEALPDVETCVKHSDEKPRQHEPGVVNSLGLHEKYFPEGR